MTVLVKKDHFSGFGKVFSEQDGLAAAVRGVAQFQALQALASVADLTDNSGGAAANGTIEAIGSFTPAVLAGTDCAQKAELEAGFGGVVAALAEIIAQANTIRAKVPAFSALTDSTGGGAADGTIAAIDVSYTGVGASLASATGANTVLTALTSRIAQATVYVNKVAVACGKAEIVDNSGGTKVYSGTFAAVSTDTGTAVSGATTAPTNAAIKATDANAVMQKLANAIKELASKLNECTGASLVANVVAG